MNNEVMKFLTREILSTHKVHKSRQNEIDSTTGARAYFLHRHGKNFAFETVYDRLKDKGSGKWMSHNI